MRKLCVDLVVTAMLVFRFGKRLDDADALRVFTNDADHAVDGSLYLCVERDAFFGDKIDGDENKGKHGDHDEREISVHQKRDRQAADEQDRRAYTHSLHHSDEAVQVIGVGRDAGFQRGDRKSIRLRRGKTERMGEEIVAYLFGKIT